MTSVLALVGASQRRPSAAAPKLAGALVVGLLMILLLPVIAILAVIGQEEAATGIGDGTGLPRLALPFLEIYKDAADVYNVNPFLLMAVHEDETTFGTLAAAGVTTGVNYAGCCAGPMQFSITGGATPAVGGTGGTWSGYRDAFRSAKLERPARYPLRHSKHPNVYDSYDAIYAAAKYFRGLGAGSKLDSKTYNALLSYKGTPPFSLPYARADYRRARELQKIAAAHDGPAAFGKTMKRLKPTSPWLGLVPGFPGATCDRRILPNLTYLIRRYKLAIGDCYALAGHAANGEHPLGVGVDIYPGAGGSWELVDQLARRAEPAPNQPVAPFRWVGYDGDPNHGRGHHLHLSWDHAPASFNSPAAWVLVAQ